MPRYFMTKITEGFTRLPENWIDDIEYQDRSLAFIDGKMKDCKYHVLNMCIGENSGIDFNSPSFLPVTDPNYVAPSKALLREVVDLIMSRGYTKAYLGEMLGVSTIQNRTINNWLSEGKDTRIPYCAWLTLTNLAGITLTTMLPVNKDKHEQ